MRACASKLGSSAKRRSGANLRLIRCATSARSSFLCRFSASMVAAAVLAAERHHRDGRELEIGRHADRGNGHRMTVEGGVEDVAARQNLGQARGG